VALLTQKIVSPHYEKGAPIIFKRAFGAKLVSEEGANYIDLQNGKGAVILGHNFPTINEALREGLEQGRGNQTGFHPTLFQVGNALLKAIKLEKVAFFKTGTEAVKAAIYAAQQAERKRIILSAGYHGFDSLWHSNEEVGKPNQNGIIDFYYNLNLFQRLIERYKHILAAVIISPDPLYFNGEWYEKFYRIAKSVEVPLIIDEVKVGFRYNYGLMVERFGWSPDIAIVSKGIANGFPLAAVMGKAKYLHYLMDHTYTSFFDPLSFIAAAKTLDIHLEENVQLSLSKVGDLLVSKIKGLFDEFSFPAVVVHKGSLFQFVFPDDYLEEEFYKASIMEGLILYTKDNQAISLSFNEQVIEDIIYRLKQVIFRLSNRLDLGAFKQPNENDFLKACWRLVDGLPNIELPLGEMKKIINWLKIAS